MIKLFLFVTILISLSKLHAEENTDDDKNPFKLFNYPTDKNDQESLDDDDNPFKLFQSKKEDKKYTKEEFTADILWHVHFIRIFLNKINENKILNKLIEAKKYPIDAIFKLQLTEEIINDFRRYSNNSNETSPSQINSYFMNLMKSEIMKNMSEDVLIDEKISILDWLETKYLLVPFGCVIILAFIYLSKIKFFFLILFCALIQKGFELYEAEELRKYTISQNIPEHCLKDGNKSFFDKLKFWKNSKKECIQYHQDLNKQTHHSINFIKVIVAVLSDVLIGVSDMISKITGLHYENLSNYLPWYLTPVFTLILFLTTLIGSAYLLFKCFELWFTNHTPVLRATTNTDRVQKHGLILSSNKRDSRKQKAIPYKNYYNK